MSITAKQINYEYQRRIVEVNFMAGIHRMSSGPCAKHGIQDSMPAFRECMACVGEFLVRHPAAMLQFVAGIPEHPGLFKLQLVGYGGTYFHYQGVIRTTANTQDPGWGQVWPAKNVGAPAPKAGPAEIDEYDLLPDAD